jgi:succinoglycan biosynthesis transport protein ExoP
MNVETNSNSFSAEAVAETLDEARTTIGRLRRKSDLGLSRSYTLRFFMGFSVVVAAFAMAWPFLPRRYEATTTIIFHPTDPESRSDSAQFLRQPLDESAMQSEIDQIASTTLAAVVLAQHSLAADPEFNGGWKSWFEQSDDLRQRLLARLSVSKDRRSYTVKFGFMSSDPVKAAALTDTLLKAYLADQLARKRKTIDNLTAWLTEQVDMLRAKSDASQLAVKDFLVQSGLIDSGATISLEQELFTLSTEAALAQSRTTDAQARADALSNLQKADKLDGAPEVVASPVIQKLKDRMAGARSGVSPVDMPQRAFEAQVAAEADRIVRSVKTEARASMEREAALQNAIKTIRDEMIRRHHSQLRLAVLRRDAESDRTALDLALVHLAAQTARANAVIPHVDIIAPPEVPIRPVFPNPLLAILGTLMAGCLAGAAMVWRPLSLWVRRVSAN